MTRESKLNNIKILLGVNNTSLDTLLGVYLDLSTQEILSWLYLSKGSVPEDVTEVPARYEVVQISAVIAGFSHNGAEGETTHKENGIDRVFKHEDMIAYIHANVYPYVGV